LSVFLTLTFARAPKKPDSARSAVQSSLRRLRDAVAGEKFAWAYVIERGARHRRSHAHVFLPAFDAVLLERAWSHGLSNLQVLPTQDDRRAGARYASKTFEDVGDGRHRYEVCQGFQPEVIRLRSNSLWEAQRHAVDFFGREPDTQMQFLLQDAPVPV